MQSQQQHRSTQIEGKLKISLHICKTVWYYENSNLYFAFRKVGWVTFLFRTSRLRLVASFGT
jgi:hypothetical protein